MNIRIVQLDGSPVGFGSGVVLRVWVIGLITAIPYRGGLIGLADILWIFGSERRCLHDYIASTCVIEVAG